MNDPDRDLRSAFAALRDEEAHSAPSLAQLLAREPAPRARWLAFALPAATAACALAVWWLAATPPGALRSPFAPAASAPPPIALGSLRGPTDALLSLPGTDPLRALPPSLIPGPPLPSEGAPSHPAERRNHA